jgi:hypothetical protein
LARHGLVGDFDEILIPIARVARTGRYEVVDGASTPPEARAALAREYEAVVADEHLGAERGSNLAGRPRPADPAMASRRLLIAGGVVSFARPRWQYESLCR